ncbi:MAG: hypothetical protein KGY53_05890 [Wenzhouxiangellaceae bacterium]|nr:hypothetical protein [Wenzhouxiangellaceae bacterium]
MAEYRTRRGRIRPVLSISIITLAGFAVLASGSPTGLKLMLLALIALAGYRSRLHGPGHVIRLEPSESPSLDGVRGNLFAEAGTGLFVAMALTPPAGPTRRVFIFRDELEADAYRSLLAFLRHG